MKRSIFSIFLIVTTKTDIDSGVKIVLILPVLLVTFTSNLFRFHFNFIREVWTHMALGFVSW